MNTNYTNLKPSERGLLLRIAIASNPSTSADVLAEAAHDRHVQIRLAVANNPTTWPATLSQLSNDGDFSVRLAVASNPNTPPDKLDRWYADLTKVTE